MQARKCTTLPNREMGQPEGAWFTPRRPRGRIGSRTDRVGIRWRNAARPHGSPNGSSWPHETPFRALATTERLRLNQQRTEPLRK